MKILIIAIILLHGLIHLMGFAKAFGLAEISELTLPVNRGWGILWLISAISLILSGILWLMNMSNWWIFAIIGLILSQILIFAFWQDARFGSIPNLIILMFIISGFVRNTPPVSMMTDVIPVPFEERYAKSTTDYRHQIINPFEISIEPMERLLLVNIENDPDRLYVGFEPQVFDDGKMGTGFLVIAWRTDGKVDVYHQPSLSPDPAGYDITGKGLENLLIRDMEGAFFEVNERGAQASVSFEDIEGRLVELKLSEKSNRTRKPFGLLAPMGMAAENPSAMPLVLLHDFYFVRRSNTELKLAIDGRTHKPDNLPLPLDFSRMTFARYCPDPLIAKLNPAFKGSPVSISINNEQIVKHDNHTIELSLNADVPEILRISRSHRHHTITLGFNPAFPNLEAFKSESATGRFEISGDPSIGLIRGEYKVVRDGNRLEIEMTPSEGWIPNSNKLSLQFLYSVQPMFKQWPTTYRWTGNLNSDENGIIHMNSSWERIHNDKKK